jgi:hypothetical protein
LFVVVIIIDRIEFHSDISTSNLVDSSTVIGTLASFLHSLNNAVGIRSLFAHVGQNVSVTHGVWMFAKVEAVLTESFDQSMVAVQLS